jgi:hypothetical protein
VFRITAEHFLKIGTGFELLNTEKRQEKGKK